MARLRVEAAKDVLAHINDQVVRVCLGGEGWPERDDRQHIKGSSRVNPGLNKIVVGWSNELRSKTSPACLRPETEGRPARCPDGV